MLLFGRTIKEKRLFQSYFMTYAAVLLIPLVAFFVIYQASTRSIREGIEN